MTILRIYAIDPMFNPMVQYEQAYVYYKYLCMQMDYKLKCKEYEKVCANNGQTDRKEKRIDRRRNKMITIGWACIVIGCSLVAYCK